MVLGNIWNERGQTMQLIASEIRISEHKQTYYHHFKFVLINHTKIKIHKIYLFVVKNVLFTPVLMLKLEQRFIHYNL